MGSSLWEWGLMGKRRSRLWRSLETSQRGLYLWKNRNCYGVFNTGVIWWKNILERRGSYSFWMVGSWRGRGEGQERDFSNGEQREHSFQLGKRNWEAWNDFNKAVVVGILNKGWIWEHLKEKTDKNWCPTINSKVSSLNKGRMWYLQKLGSLKRDLNGESVLKLR